MLHLMIRVWIATVTGSLVKGDEVILKEIRLEMNLCA